MGAAIANMCLLYPAIGLSQFLGEMGKKILNKMVGENRALVSCVSHCDMSVTFILFSLHFLSIDSQYLFREMISKEVDMIFIEKCNSKVKQGCNIFYLTSSTESRQSLHI